MKQNNHTTFRNGNLFCTHCGGEFVIKIPMPVDSFSNKIKSFNSLHKDCEKTWVEPTADQNESIIERANWWIANGATGMSSKTMWNCFMGNTNYRVYHPYDPDDFSRCYKLLESVPEWKDKLHLLKPLSKEWHNLVDNWQRLTEMYESRSPGMYKFMEKLIQ